MIAVISVSVVSVLVCVLLAVVVFAGAGGGGGAPAAPAPVVAVTVAVLRYPPCYVRCDPSCLCPSWAFVLMNKSVARHGCFPK